MTRTERKKLIKKYNRRIIINWVLLGLFFVLLTIELIYLRTSSTLLIGLALVSIFSPLFIFLVSVASLGIISNKYGLEKKRIEKEKHKFHLKLFWESIESKQYNKAIYYYNTNNFLSPIDQIMCEGILIGINYVSDNVDAKMKSVARMNEFIL